MIELIIGFTVGIVGNILVVEIYNLIQKKQEHKSTLTGEWKEINYDDTSNNVISIDIVNCKHNQKTRELKGKIQRVEPKEQNHKTWEFKGMFVNNSLYAFYWSTSDKNPSHGTIQMVYDTEIKEFEGYYVKLKSTYSKSETNKPIIMNELSEHRLVWKLKT